MPVIHTQDGRPVDDTNPLPTSVTGRKAKVEWANYDQVLNVLASGTTTITITPPAGELWRIKGLYLNVPAPAGGSAGSHGLYFGMGNNINAGRNWGLSASSNFGDVITVQYNVIVSATASAGKFPTSEQAQAANVLNTVATNAQPLFVYYLNSTTGGTQTGSLKITIIREVEYIS